MEMIEVNGEIVYVEIADLGSNRVPEVLRLNEDGTKTIFLNSRFSQERLQQAYEHAITHIKNQDFKEGNIQQIEANAHNIPEMSDEEVHNLLRKESIEHRRRSFVRKHNKTERTFKQNQDFYDELMFSSPRSYDSLQNDIIGRY